MSRQPDLDFDSLVWQAREAAVRLVTASLEGALADDPSLPSTALQAAEAAIPARQQAAFRDRLLLSFSEVVGTVLAVTTQAVGAGGDGSIEAVAAGALDYWRQVVPLILDGAPATEDLAGVGETLTAELERWLGQQRPEDGSCPG